MHRDELESEPGILDNEHWQENIGPVYRHCARNLLIVLPAGTPFYLIYFFYLPFT